MSYVKQLANTVRHLVRSFKLGEANNAILRGTAKINAAVSNYKLWRSVRAGHKLLVYTFATKQHIKWLKFAIGDKAELMILNINNANTEYVPFARANLGLNSAY